MSPFNGTIAYNSDKDESYQHRCNGEARRDCAISPALPAAPVAGDRAGLKLWCEGHPRGLRRRPAGFSPAETLRAAGSVDLGHVRLSRRALSWFSRSPVPSNLVADSRVSRGAMPRCSWLSG